MSLFIHQTAIIDDNVEIGDGTKIWHFTHIEKGSKIGINCNIGQNVYIGKFVQIGNYCKIQNNSSIYEGVKLEDYVFCGPSVVFTNVRIPRSKYPKRKEEYMPTLVKEGATIGANSTILCGITLGKYSFIGASSFVNRDVLDFSLVVGNPAKQIAWISEAGERLIFNIDNIAECKISNKKYLLNDGKVYEI